MDSEYKQLNKEFRVVDREVFYIIFPFLSIYQILLEETIGNCKYEFTELTKPYKSALRIKSNILLQICCTTFHTLPLL